jgi:hypothetical protein
MDVYLSTVSNHLNAVKQLAVIATTSCNSPHKIGVCWLGA